MEKKFKHADICKELNNIYIVKNADYGDSFGKSYERYGKVMAAIRLNDKLNRFEQLIEHKGEVKDESIRDTLMDLANYAIMTVMEMELEEEKRATKERKQHEEAKKIIETYENNSQDYLHNVLKKQRDKAEYIACAETFF